MKTKHFVFLLLTVLLIYLTGCGPDNDVKNATPTPTPTPMYDVLLQYHNYVVNREDVETISIFTEDNKCIHIITPNPDGSNSTEMRGNGSYLYSHTLDKEFALPQTDENHIVVVDIDYDTKEITAHLEEK